MHDRILGRLKQASYHLAAASTEVKAVVDEGNDAPFGIVLLHSLVEDALRQIQTVCNTVETIGSQAAKIKAAREEYAATEARGIEDAV